MAFFGVLVGFQWFFGFSGVFFGVLVGFQWFFGFSDGFFWCPCRFLIVFKVF